MNDRLPLPAEALLAPFSTLYAGIMRMRNLAYSKGLLAAEDPGVPVLSVGNLTAGGTGKTPLTELLVRALSESGLRVGVISRGYRGSSKAVSRVRPNAGAEEALAFGDEPTWLAKRFPKVPVYVGVEKAKVCRALLADERVDLIIADDAFQHRRLRRALDAVVIDASEPRWHYRPLPLGRMREGFGSLSRAQAVFLTKVNLADESQRDWLRARIAEVRNPLGISPAVYEMGYRITAFSALGEEGQTVEPAALQGQSILLVSGIARPATFPQLVREAASGSEIREHLIFADHHPFGPADRDRIEARAKALGVDRIVVTEKDAVKLVDWRPEVQVLVSRLEARALTDLKEFYALVSRLVL